MNASTVMSYYRVVAQYAAIIGEGKTAVEVSFRSAGIYVYL